MKQNWVRLADMVRRRGGSRAFVEPQFQNLFLRHHRNATEIVCNKSGEPLAAVYITPIGDHQEMVKNIMREIQERMQYAAEMDGARSPSGISPK